MRLDDDPSFLLARANALSVQAGNAALAELGLRVRTYSVLALAADDVPPSQRELADHLQLDPSQVVALVDELEDRGLVTRQTLPSDRRSKVVGATASGRELLLRAEGRLRDAQQRVHGRLTPAQGRQLTVLLALVAFPDAR